MATMILDVVLLWLHPWLFLCWIRWDHTSSTRDTRPAINRLYVRKRDCDAAATDVGKAGEEGKKKEIYNT